jgi:restriction system protein
MARRKKTPIEDVIYLASMLPWWGGLTLSLVSFLILSYISNLEVSQIKDVSQMGDFVVKQMVITFAMFGQIILPFVFIIAAIASFIKQKKGEKLFSKVEKFQESKIIEKSEKVANPLDHMSWKDFEMIISQFFRQRGFSVVYNVNSGRDGGIDLRIKKNGKTTLVQCKHWKSRKVGVHIVREQLGIQFSNLADSSIIVTSGAFTVEAINFAKENNISLIGGAKLLQLISKTQIRESNTQIEEPKERNISIPIETCPLCSSKMVLRIAKKGRNVGTKFWGCSLFPKCKHTKSF